MRVHYLQHVPFEDIGAVRDWIWARGHALSGTELFRGAAADASTPAAASTSPAGSTVPALPAVAGFDFLVVMGGPMNVYESDRYPWLEAEKAFIAEAIAAGKAVLGICLGAQLLAEVLGGPVTKAPEREIGWWPVELTEAACTIPVFADFPDTFAALHWHGDTFACPPGATHVASSEACPNQAFAHDGGRVVGLQFHIEETQTALKTLFDNARADLAADPSEHWVAAEHGILRWDAPYDACRGLLFSLLDRMAAAVMSEDGA